MRAHGGGGAGARAVMTAMSCEASCRRSATSALRASSSPRVGPASSVPHEAFFAGRDSVCESATRTAGAAWTQELQVAGQGVWEAPLRIWRHGGEGGRASCTRGVAGV